MPARHHPPGQRSSDNTCVPSRTARRIRSRSPPAATQSPPRRMRGSSPCPWWYRRYDADGWGAFEWLPCLHSSHYNAPHAMVVRIGYHENGEVISPTRRVVNHPYSSSAVSVAVCHVETDHPCRHRSTVTQKPGKRLQHAQPWPLLVDNRHGSSRAQSRVDDTRRLSPQAEGDLP